MQKPDKKANYGVHPLSNFNFQTKKKDLRWNTCTLWETGFGSWKEARIRILPPNFRTRIFHDTAQHVPCYRLDFVDAQYNPAFRQWIQQIERIDVNACTYARTLYSPAFTACTYQLYPADGLIALHSLSFTGDTEQIQIYAAGYEPMELTIVHKQSAQWLARHMHPLWKLPVYPSSEKETHLTMSM